MQKKCIFTSQDDGREKNISYSQRFLLKTAHSSNPKDIGVSSPPPMTWTLPSKNLQETICLDTLRRRWGEERTGTCSIS